MPSVPDSAVRIKATTWSVEDCAEILSRLVDGPQSRFHALHEKIEKRRQHFHNLKEANPQLPAPYTGKSEYQTDALRRTHIKHRARIIENPPIVRVSPPRSTEKMKALADQFETVLNRIYDIVQERTGENFQSLVCDGQDRDCYGAIHWVKADHILPKFPDAELLDELPEDESEAKRYEERLDSADGKGRYQETDISRQERDRHAKARAGAPWHIEVIDPHTFGFVSDITTANGFGVFAWEREVGILDYNDALFKSDGVTVSLNAADKRVMVGMERQRPPEGSDSEGPAWGTKITVGTIWSRDECYELARGSVQGTKTPWEMVKSWKHPYEMPPFALAYGHRNQHPDPVQAYEPVLEGIYRIKPGYDYVMALNEIIAQSIALPVWWIEDANGQPRLDEKGKPVTLSRDLANAVALRPGEKLVKAEFDLNPAFIELVRLRQEELKEAGPSVGLSEVSSTTQAWAILLQEQQASIEPKQIVSGQVRMFRTMFRNMALVMSKSADEGGFGQAINVYGKTKDGKVDTSTVIGIEPKDIPTLEVDVEINPRSAAEVITRTEHGLNLLEKRVITLPEFKADYQSVERPEEGVKDNIAWWAFEDFVKPGLIKQELAKQYANYIVIGPNGTFVGFDGQEMTPEQVLQANGQTPIPMPQPAPTGGGMGMPSMGATPGALPPLNVPTAMPVRGVPV